MSEVLELVGLWSLVQWEGNSLTESLVGHYDVSFNKEQAYCFDLELLKCGADQNLGIFGSLMNWLKTQSRLLSLDYL